jgi:hypothetical protein
MKTNRLLGAIFAFAISAGAFAQTVDEIVDKHIAAVGGLDKIKSVTSLITDRSLALNGMEIPSKTTILVGKGMRTESTVMGNSMVEVIDGSTGWMIRPTMMGGTGEPEEMPADQVKQRAGQLDPFGPLVNYKEKGNKVELVGTEKVDKKDNFHLKVTTKDGQEVALFLDANTYLLSKMRATMNGQEGEISFSDYKETDGIKFANAMEMTNPQMGMLSFLTNKVIVNSKLDESILKKPVK